MSKSSNSDQHINQTQDTKSGMEPNAVENQSSDDTVSILDLVLVFLDGAGTIARAIAVCLILGAGYALIADDEYRSEVQVVREAREGTQSLGGAGLGALRGFGINIGSSSGGLTIDGFPNVLRSREVRRAVARDTFEFPGQDVPMTFVEFVDRPPGVVERIFDYTIYLPWTLKSGMEASDEDDEVQDRLERRAMKTVGRRVGSSIDSDSGLMTISTTANSPELAAQLAESFVYHLTIRIREIRTKSVREQLEFIEGQFQDARDSLQAAEDNLARFLERNQNPTSASLQFQEDRLQRQVQFKQQLYNDLQSQLTQTRLELQRKSPVVTVVEAPVPPTDPSGLSTLRLILASLFAGIFIGVALVLVRVMFSTSTDNTPRNQKVRRIQDKLVEMKALLHRSKS